MNHGSLFSGIGGFDLAAERMGWTNKFHCEWNPFGQKVLKHYWPEAESYSDITKTDFTLWRGKIDILTGGFPCQPYSTAGKRLGKEDDRHLWPEMLRAIREIQPRYVVGENVSGLINWNGGMVFEEVQTELEAEGYEVTPFVLPAAGVGAPHRRDRIWFVAYSESNGDRGGLRPVENSNGGQRESKEYGKKNNQSRDNGSQRIAPDSESKQSERMRSKQRETCEQEPFKLGRNCGRVGCERIDTNACDSGLQRSSIDGSIGAIREDRNKQPPGLLPSTWQDFPTQSPICTGDDGFPTELDGITISKWRNESIKAAGNAIVHQVAVQIFQAIEAFEKLLTV